jgi:5-hydroxyisourate hydrolase
MRPPITSHVLNLGNGLPVAGLKAKIMKYCDDDWTLLGEAVTDDDGRIDSWLNNVSIEQGEYRVIFETSDYFSSHKLKCFYPEVSIHFVIEDSREHFHIPLLLNQYGYSTYRGS